MATTTAAEQSPLSDRECLEQLIRAVNMPPYQSETGRRRQRPGEYRVEQATHFDAPSHGLRYTLCTGDDEREDWVVFLFDDFGKCTAIL